jgi:small subunit ribosomal protein S1
MVNKRFHQSRQDEPPMPDESWWEAVMAEDEMQHCGTTLAKSNPALQASNQRPLNQGGEAELNQLNWRKALELYEQDQAAELIVTGYNRGGLLVNGDGLQGFVPISHLVGMPCQVPDPERWLENYIGQTLQLKVIECDQQRGRIVFCERAAQSMPGSRKQLMKTLKPGDCTYGKITNITDFGVFVDLGGVEGLIHVSELSWGRVHHPADVVSLGEEVRVYVIQIDQERGRVALSLKRMYPNPWETVEERYCPGQIAEAEITSVVSFGAFARLEEGLDGLIHVSEFQNEQDAGSSLPNLKEGQKVRVRVLHVDAARQRLGLSMKLEDKLS